VHDATSPLIHPLPEVGAPKHFEDEGCQLVGMQGLLNEPCAFNRLHPLARLGITKTCRKDYADVSLFPKPPGEFNPVNIW
jgi:hypothetical protein